MNRTLTIAIFAAAALALQAQDNPVSSDLQKAYKSIQGNILKAAEEMPEADYGFKPTSDIRSFGALVAHIADAQGFYCGMVNSGGTKPNAGSKTSKADIIAALKTSNSDCDAVYDALTDASGKEMVKTRSGQLSKLSVAVRNYGHDEEEYGYLAVYLRLKNLTPPSSQRNK